jgi:hypothetical protein
MSDDTFMTKCIPCEGSGVLLTTWSRGPGNPPGNGYIRCAICGGTGLIDNRKQETREPVSEKSADNNIVLELRPEASDAMRTIYQLTTEGESRNGWPFKMRSKAVFEIRSVAEGYISEFEAMCYDDNHFKCAVPGSLKTTILELELYD